MGGWLEESGQQSSERPYKAVAMNSSGVLSKTETHPRRRRDLISD